MKAGSDVKNNLTISSINGEKVCTTCTKIHKTFQVGTEMRAAPRKHGNPSQPRHQRQAQRRKICRSSSSYRLGVSAGACSLEISNPKSMLSQDKLNDFSVVHRSVSPKLPGMRENLDKLGGFSNGWALKSYWILRRFKSNSWFF